MRKLYSLLPLFFCAYGYTQTIEIPPHIAGIKAGGLPPGNASAARPMATCSADTILYPYRKEQQLATTPTFAIDAMVGNVRTASQAYINTAATTVKGVQFWGAAYSADPQFQQTLNVQVSVWSVNAQYMPLTELATSTMTITGEYKFYSALFSTPVNVTGDYAVTVKSVPNDTLGIKYNNAGDAANSVNYGEGLGWRRFGSGSWNSTPVFLGQDVEYMIFPIVELGITTDFTTSAPAEQYNPQPFTNTTTGHLASRFYNLNVFRQYWGLSATDNSYGWTFGDGGTSSAKNPTHAYTSPGSYNVSLTATLNGYFRNCQDAVTKPLQVNPGVKADTLQYAYRKEQRLGATPTFSIDAMVGNVRTASQGYVNTGTMSLKGVQFWGAAYTATPSFQQTLAVQVAVWSVNAQFMPVTELATSTMNITSDYQFYTALFATPVNVTGNYAVTVKSIPNDTLGIMYNNAGDAGNSVNYGEGLGWRRFGSGSWNSTPVFLGQDVEYMIFPVIIQQGDAAFTTDGLGVNGQPETFPNTSDALFNNRMANLNAFDKYWNLSPTDTTYYWNYGDGVREVRMNGQHTYTANGNYTVSLMARLKGYFVNYSDTAVSNMVVSFALPATLSRFTADKLGTTNRLQWTALTEENMDAYVIERSADGRSFSDVGRIVSLNKDNSQYAWIDAQPETRSFYRLRIVNSNGTFTHSATVLLTRDRHRFEVFTTAQKLLLISESRQPYTITVYAPGGALLGRQTINAVQGQQSISLPWLESAATGVYIAVVEGNGESKTVKVLKQ